MPLGPVLSRDERYRCKANATINNEVAFGEQRQQLRDNRIYRCASFTMIMILRGVASEPTKSSRV
jgi:hypothetical protein